MIKKQYIGVCGNARVGKDTFCAIAINQLKRKGITAKQYALAYSLKKDTEQFIQEKFGLDVWSEDTAIKTVIRPFLVAYGDIRRAASKGRCFTEILQPKIEEDPSDVVFISDIRYSEYEKDEQYWIQKELGGKLVHIDAYKYTLEYNEFEEIPPANDNEQRNYTKLSQTADIKLRWEILKDKTPDIINNTGLNYIVQTVLEDLNII